MYLKKMNNQYTGLHSQRKKQSKDRRRDDSEVAIIS